MALRTTNSAESWERVYKAFEEVNFAAFDYDTIKASLVEYMQIYYPESFNDMIETDELIAVLEMFAYVAEQLAYRIDVMAHENVITSAQRKQSILKLIKMVSYKATRNIPARGMVKITSVSSTEDIFDSRGINLSESTIRWNDNNNTNWKDQFILVMNRILTSRFGQPQKTQEIEDVLMEQYTLKNNLSSFVNGVYKYSVSTGSETFPMEIVPADLGEDGPFEREPDTLSQFQILYSSDGVGDGSDFTGFMMFTKQGTLTSVDYNIDQKLPNRRIDMSPTNINNTDVWVQEVLNDGSISSRWVQVESLNEQNLFFNNIQTRKKYEVDTREGDQISIIFGDGDFAEAPLGTFRFWARQSANRSMIIQKNKIVDQAMSFKYVGQNGATETCTLTFSLVSTIQNAAPTETIEHMRSAAPATFYSQNRMVNGQDYNTFPLKDVSILKIKTINRTFAGQPKHIDWNDASGKYENVKLFGDDLSIRYLQTIDAVSTDVSGQSLIDSVIEPLLETRGIINNCLHLSASDPVTSGVVSSPRRFFIEDNRPNVYKVGGTPIQISKSFVADGSLKEKTSLQGLIDRHWYGEPIEYVQLDDGTVLAKIPDPLDDPKDDGKIYSPTIPRTIDGVNKYPPGDKGSELQRIAQQPFFALRYNRYFDGIGDGVIQILNRPQGSPTDGIKEVWTIEFSADGRTFNVRSNIRGSFPTGTIGEVYYIQPDGFDNVVSFFTISEGSVKFEAGDSFVLDCEYSGLPVQRTGTSFNSSGVINLMGWWQILESDELESYYSGGYIGEGDEHLFNVEDTITADTPNGPVQSTSPIKKHSWLIFVRKIFQTNTDTVIGYEVSNRNLKLIVESENTKFWYNEVDKILDMETYKPVYDNIKLLRSNLDANGLLLRKNQVYDVVGAVKNDFGITDFHKLEVVPTDLLQEDDSGNLVPDRLLQFENFSLGSYQYFSLSNPEVILTGPEEATAIAATWTKGSFVDSSATYGRIQIMGSDDGLDFMWQHFSPFTNIIDPSPTNIIDVYVITRGFYDNTMMYLRGLSSSAPDAPTSFELRNSYSSILEKKMISDTVVMHSGKFKLMFGANSDPQLRAKFKVVRNPTGSLSNERIKEEILSVIDKYFELENWDFGKAFHATELIGLIHQRLPADLLSVVLVPQYSTNSFGDMLIVPCGHNEILMSCAQLSDIEIVDSFTNAILRKK